MTTPSEVVAAPSLADRLDLADSRGFTRPGAGAARRERVAARYAAWLATVWAEATGARPTDGLALAAVGSLARREAGPLSDIDLVLVHSGRARTGDITALAERLWYPVWDAGVRLDHSVRTPAQCRAVASGDLSATVGLLDLTWLAGDREVVASARQLVAHDWRASSRRRLPQLVEAVRARHGRHGDLAQSLEPDLKEAKGGLRDLTVLAALREAWLADVRHSGLDDARSLVLDVRDALHVVTGRGRERLVREEQDAVASLFGYPDADDLLTAVLGAGRTIGYAVESGLRRAGQAQRARALRVGPRRPSLRPLGFGVHVSDGEVVLGSARPVTDPRLPLRAALAAARAGLPLAPSTLDNLAAAPPLPTPWPAETLGTLTDLLASGPGLVQVWESLDVAGLVESWLPEWAGVRSRPQRNPVHRHTVDRHLLETLVRAATRVREVARPDLLLLGALLHDIGKVRGAHDHSAEGELIAGRACARFGVPEADIATVCRLVREHLTLVDLATRRDLDDPATVDAAVAAVDGRTDILDLLLALTRADAEAAGPTAWTDWRAGLLTGLELRVRERLGSPADTRVEREPPPALPPEVRAAVGSGAAVVRSRVDGSGYVVEVVDRDRLGLFADTAGLLTAYGMVVRSATVRTTDDGVAHDVWRVESPGGAQPDEAALARALTRLRDGDRAPLRVLGRPRPDPVPAGGGLTRALVLPSASQTATVIEVRAGDRPGLLSDIGSALAGAGVSVRSAHVATYAGQSLDTFYVTEARGERLPPGRVAHVIALVIDACDA